MHLAGCMHRHSAVGLACGGAHALRCPILCYWWRSGAQTTLTHPGPTGHATSESSAGPISNRGNIYEPLVDADAYRQ